MKGDFTRSTFRKENHYSSVRMQQGRVQLDADWNEQLDITAHRVETETVDVVGHCGAPMHHGGFHIVAKPGDLATEEKTRPENQNPPALEPKGDVYITGGHYYVDGILCENEHIAAYTKQPDLPETKPVATKGTYLAYLDVWHRHLTALEAPHIREVALGGPDTATRTKTVWQVKVLRLGDLGMTVTCLSGKLPVWDDEIAPGLGRLAAQAETSAPSADPCILSPDSGYRRLENQLYRVEVHTGGKRGKATFKWSRDNGSIVTTWEKQDVNKLTVSSIGRDQVLHFASGQWIELTDDRRELWGKPGILVQLEKVEGQVLTIDPATIIDLDDPSATSVDKARFPHNPKIRRWDSDGQIKPTNANWIDLEDGVQVQFGAGTYKSGDYWLIPARTAAGNIQAGIEWPVNQITKKPELQPPHGIHHQYCWLALMQFDGSTWTSITDCRHIFPPLTELTSLLYVSGDGQEAMPGNKLDWPLQVRVVNGQHPVAGARVHFTLEAGSGTLSGSTVESTSDGIAECEWTLGTSGKQQVKAELRDAAGHPVPGQLIHFTAGLSVASEVAYDPSACPSLKDAETVQAAIDILCTMDRGGGCAVTVGPGGQYGTLEQAFGALKEKRDICLCLLPGTHEINKDVAVDNKNIITISGCGMGSIIHQKCPTLAFGANQILLYDLNVEVQNKRGSIILTGEEVAAERCRFERHVGMQGVGPLMRIAAMPSGRTNLSWKDNRMSAWWIETIPQGAKEVLLPSADVRIPKRTRNNLERLSKTDPYVEKETYDKTLEGVAKEVENLPREVRANWFDNRPGERIRRLPANARDASEKFYTLLTKDRPSIKMLKDSITAAFEAFHVFYYTIGLALEQGVGGWVEDTILNGYLALHYGEQFTPPRWNRTNEDQQQNKRSFADKYTYLTASPVGLNLRGNQILSVHSNADALMKIIDGILSGQIPGFEPDIGYQFMNVGDNRFQTNGNSFVCKSLIMNANNFSGAARPSDVAAYVIAEDGIFVGDLALDAQAAIETILKSSRTKKEANLVQVL
jgi:hypothetical protein